MTTDLNFTRVIMENIRELDTRDESQIMAELAGETVSEMFYTTEVLDRRTRKMVPKPKLSWAGTKEAARSKGNIVVDETPMITETDDAFRIVVRVTDLSRNFTIFGGCHQPKKMRINEYDNNHKLTGYRLEDDPYAFQKGLSKAQRNAIQTILPADYIAKALDRFMVISSRQALRSGDGKKELKQPAKKELKAQLAWAEVTEDMVKDYNSLEKIFWDITKKQPVEMYKELGVSSRIELSITPWEAFIQLRETFDTAKV